MKSWLQDFPTTTGRIVATLLLILSLGCVVAVRLARGLDFPAGYDVWIYALIILSGVDGAVAIGKRLSDFRYKAAGTSPVNVEAPSSVTVTAEPVLTKPGAEQAAEILQGKPATFGGKSQ